MAANIVLEAPVPGAGSCSSGLFPIGPLGGKANKVEMIKLTTPVAREYFVLVSIAIPSFNSALAVKTMFRNSRLA